MFMVAVDEAGVPELVGNRWLRCCDSESKSGSVYYRYGEGVHVCSNGQEQREDRCPAARALAVGLATSNESDVT